MTTCSLACMSCVEVTPHSLFTSATKATAAAMLFAQCEVSCACKDKESKHRTSCVRGLNFHFCFLSFHAVKLRRNEHPLLLIYNVESDLLFHSSWGWGGSVTQHFETVSARVLRKQLGARCGLHTMKPRVTVASLLKRCWHRK